MKIYLTVSLLFLFKLTVAQELPEELVPPNSIKLKDSLYIDKTEIANVHWLEYLHYLKQDSSQKYYESMLPDTAIWSSMVGFDSAWGSFYLRYPKYRYKPIVGIDQTQAKAYSKWRSDAVTLLFNKKFKEILEKNGIDSIIYEFRLPTPEEWELAAYGSLPSSSYGVQKLPFEYRDLILNQLDRKGVKSILGDTVDFKLLTKNLQKYRSKKHLAFRVLPDEIPYFITIRDLIPEKIDKGPTNYFGLYHMIGNLAEMTTNSHLVKGGSWLNKLSDINLEAGRYWDGMPKVWIGFRNVCQVSVIPQEPRAESKVQE